MKLILTLRLGQLPICPQTVHVGTSTQVTANPVYRDFTRAAQLNEEFGRLKKLGTSESSQLRGPRSRMPPRSARLKLGGESLFPKYQSDAILGAQRDQGHYFDRTVRAQ